MKIIKKLFQNYILEKKPVFRGILAVCMVVAGLSHFVFPVPYIKIVPDLLPYPGVTSLH